MRAQSQQHGAAQSFRMPLNSPPKWYNGSMSSIVVALNQHHLKTLIDEAMAAHGPACSLNHIDVSSVKIFTSVFEGSPFNGDISEWDTSGATTMENMFRNSVFNGDISQWNTSRVESMEGMFEDSLFASDIANWDVSNVQTMAYMFAGSKFNGDISRWNTCSVKTMLSMFESSQFNTSIAHWSTESLQTTRGMFKYARFNGDLSHWDVRNLLEGDMHKMFWSSAFKGDLSAWVISSKLAERSIFELLGESFRGKPPSTTLTDAKDIYTRMFGSSDAVAGYAHSNPFNALHLNLSLQADKCPNGVSAQDYAWVQEQKKIGESLGLSPAEIRANALVQYDNLGKDAPSLLAADVSEMFDYAQT